MRQRVWAVTALGFLVTVGSAACDKGPIQRTGKKIDPAADQDQVISKGPIEKDLKK